MSNITEQCVQALIIARGLKDGLVTINDAYDEYGELSLRAHLTAKSLDGFDYLLSMSTDETNLQYYTEAAGLLNLTVTECAEYGDYVGEYWDSVKNGDEMKALADAFAQYMSDNFGDQTHDGRVMRE